MIAGALNGRRFANAVLVAWSKGLEGFPIRKRRGRPSRDNDNQVDIAAPTKKTVAAILTDLGVKGVKSTTIDNARRFEHDPTASVAVIFPSDIELAKRLQHHVQFAALERLLKPSEKASFREAAFCKTGETVVNRVDAVTVPTTV